jgi:hypothetical protein
VIEHYVDGESRYAGLMDFVKHVLVRKRRANQPPLDRSVK